MWWAIGFGVLVIAVLIFVKLRTASNQVQLVNAARTHLWQSFRLLRPTPDNLFEKRVDPAVWDDPYLLGYAQGSLSMMTTFYGKNLNTVQKGMVTLHVLKDLAPDYWEDACNNIEQLSHHRDPEFARGVTHGSNVTILMANRAGSGLLAEPEVQAALREAPSQAQLAERLLGVKDNSQSSTAGAVLMQTYMRQHGLEAGY